MKTIIETEEDFPTGKICLRCAAWFEYKRCSKKYCSDSCKQIAYLERKSNKTELIKIQTTPEKKIGFIKRIINRIWKK